MRKTVFFAVALTLGLAALAFTGCAEKTSPSNPSAPTNTFTATAFTTPTLTPANTLTATPSSTPTATATATRTASSTSTSTPTSSWSPSASPTLTSTPAVSSTPTNSPTVTDTPTITLTPTATSSPTPTLTLTPTTTTTFVCTALGGIYGQNANNGSNVSSPDNMIVARFQFNQSVRVTDIQIYICASGSTTFNVGIYSDVSGSPGTLVSPVASLVSPYCSTVIQVNFPGSGVPLQAGYYWLAEGSTDTPAFFFSGALGPVYMSDVSGSGSIPSIFPNATANSWPNVPEIYADWVCP